MQIPAAAREVLASAALAHLVTLNEDGSAHVTLAWCDVEDREIVMATLPDQRKLRNIRHDPRVAISLETERTNEHGLREYLVVYGRARVTEGGGPELLQRLAYTYIGPGVRFPPMPDPPAGYVTRVTPERFAGIGPWA